MVSCKANKGNNNLGLIYDAKYNGSIMRNCENSKQLIKKLGLNLLRIRKENGLTQRDMSDYQITRAYYGKLEVGQHAATVDKLFLIAKAFGVNVADLFVDENGIPL